MDGSFPPKCSEHQTPAENRSWVPPKGERRGKQRCSETLALPLEQHNHREQPPLRAAPAHLERQIWAGKGQRGHRKKAPAVEKAERGLGATLGLERDQDVRGLQRTF